MKAALTFKYEDETPEGEAIGPAVTWDEDDPNQPVLEDLGWMSISQAKALAQERGYAFYED